MAPVDFVSVMVPTHNRRSAVSRLLVALEDQDYPLDQLEIIVVADGCTDDTADVLSRYRGPLSLRVMQQPGRGPAAARNAGAASAKGEWLLFLDDDVVPSPSLVSAHLTAHRRSPESVVIGPYPPAHVGASLFDLTVQAWWRNAFEARTGVRNSFTSVLTGNLSIPADLFQRLGGFDSRFRAHEDYEFGMRLIAGGVPVVYEPEALALHHHQSNVARHIERKADEGRADTMLLKRYPDLVAELPLYRLMVSPAWRNRIIRALALRRLLANSVPRSALLGLLTVLDRAGLRDAWRTVRGLLETYAYLEAVADKLGGVQRVVSFCRSLASHEAVRGVQLDLDLSQGIAEAERQLDVVRPAGARVRYGSQLIGIIPPRPGAEPLRGVHLRGALAGMAVSLLEALALDGAIVDGSFGQRGAVCAAIRRQRDWFGPVRPGQMWFEQYSQWQRFERPDIAAHPRADGQIRADAHASRARCMTKRALKMAWRPLADAGAFMLGAMLVPGFQTSAPWGLVACALVFAAVSAMVRPLVPYLTCPVVLVTLAPALLLLNTGVAWVIVMMGRTVDLGIETPGAIPLLLVACVIGAARLSAAGVVRSVEAWYEGYPARARNGETKPVLMLYTEQVDAGRASDGAPR
jgi:GT2 family glycosyltransferase/uncharacterized membrane protein YvlD (DUF360 family)